MKRTELLRAIEADSMRFFQLRAAAYHEAGHTTMVYYVGWILNPEGVSIDPENWVGNTGHRCRVYEYTQHNELLVTLAGWLSEHKYHGKGNLRLDEDLEWTVDHCRERLEYPDDWIDEPSDDDFIFFSLLLRDNPNITDAEMITKYRDYQKQVQHILNNPDLWKIVEAIAQALVEKHQLYHGEVVKMYNTIYLGYDGDEHFDIND